MKTNLYTLAALTGVGLICMISLAALETQLIESAGKPKLIKTIDEAINGPILEGTFLKEDREKRYVVSTIRVKPKSTIGWQYAPFHTLYEDQQKAERRAAMYHYWSVFDLVPAQGQELLRLQRQWPDYDLIPIRPPAPIN
jgi:hypothetical protein